MTKLKIIPADPELGPLSVLRDAMNCILATQPSPTGNLELPFSLYSMGTHTLQVHKESELKFLSSSEEGWKGRSSRGQAALGSLPFSTPCPEISSNLESSLRNPSQNSRASFHLLPKTEKQLLPTVPLSGLTPPSTRQQLYTTVYFLPANAPCLTYENQGLSNPVSHTGTQALFSCLFSSHCLTLCLFHATLMYLLLNPIKSWSWRNNWAKYFLIVNISWSVPESSILSWICYIPGSTQFSKLVLYYICIP